MTFTVDHSIVLTAITDQELTIKEIESEIRANQNTLKNPLADVLEDCIRKKFLRRAWVNGISYFENTQSLPRNCYLVR